MKKPARRKPAKLRKEDSVRVRLTEAQKKAMQQAADKAGLDLSSWLRMVALKAAEGGKNGE